jgi:hypothetical protein
MWKSWTARRLNGRSASSHPEKTFPYENTQLPAIIYGQKPPLVKVDEIDRFEKGFLARAPSGNPGVFIRKFEFLDGNLLGQ